MALQSGVSINGKGGKIEVSKTYDYFWESSNTRSIYFEIPINLIYTQHITKSLKFVAGGGPYLSVGIGGKNNYFGTTGDLTGYPFSGNKTITYGRQTDKFEGTYSRLTAIDFGLNAITAFEYKKCQIYFNYGFGLQDVKPKGVPMNMGKNRTLTFGMGYTLR